MLGTLSDTDAAALLDKIGDNVNMLYARHRPPLVNAMLSGQAAITNTWYRAIVPSADALQYDVRVHVAGGLTSQAIDIYMDYRTGDSTGTPWTALTGWAPNTHSLTSALSDWVAGTVTIPAAARYLRLRVDDQSGARTVQGKALLILPSVQTSIAVGAPLASGFIGYEEALLTATGGTCHTETFNRIARNVACVLRDRRQAVVDFMFVDNVSSDTWTKFTGGHSASGDVASVPLFKGITDVYGNRSARLQVSMRVDDPNSGTLTVGQEGGWSLELDCDDTDNAGTLDLVDLGGAPTFYAYLHPGGAGNVQPHYVSLDWVPGDGEDS